MAKFVVEIKAKRTGEWYTKTETDSYAAACSVAMVQSMGRATRITDTESDEIVYEQDES